MNLCTRRLFLRKTKGIERASFQGQYSKITFRSPLYVGGSPTAYWLVRATGTNRGFVGCIQSLTINNRLTDIRPWPVGRALSGADIGEEASSPGGGCVCLGQITEFTALGV